LIWISTVKPLYHEHWMGILNVQVKELVQYKEVQLISNIKVGLNPCSVYRDFRSVQIGD